jgi:antitoxin ChpS
VTSVNVRKVGGSLMIALPAAATQQFRLSAGSKLSVHIGQEEISVRPVKAKRYTLEELLAQCDPNVPRSEEEIEWLNDPPRGRELI